jgi:NAD+ kinase
MSEPLTRLALVASPTDRAQDAATDLRASREWVDFDDADGVVALGGDGFMLQILHHMLDSNRILPVYGINLGTVGFLMNRLKSSRTIEERVARARRIAVSPLWMEATTNSDEVMTSWAINEVSLLRETRQTAKLEVSVNGKVRIAELSCDGVLVATPAGSTAYNLSANGPILPLGSNMLALTPISPFRPRRWRGAILPESAEIVFRAREAVKRPVLVVADQKEVRDVREVRVRAWPEHRLTLLFDKGKSLDERIFAEQFMV